MRMFTFDIGGDIHAGLEALIPLLFYCNKHLRDTIMAAGSARVFVKTER